MALKLKGSTSGFVGLDAPSVAGNNTLILPENSGSAFQVFANDITAGVTTFTTVTVNRNGDLTVPGTISIGGTLTYEDVTSVDSVGIVTARSGVRVTSDGSTSANYISAGGGDDLKIFYDGTNSHMNATGLIMLDGTDGVRLEYQNATRIHCISSGVNLVGDVDVADKIFHTGDTDTAIRFPAANTFTVETAGSERLRVTSTGLIGIGTDNPLSGAAGARVNIYFKDETTYDSTTNRANGLIINNTASGGYSSLELGQRTTSGNTYGSAIINAVDPADGNQYGADLTFQTRATGSGNYGERMRITATGQVLIGTASARAVGGESNPRLHIEGSGNTSNSWVNITRFQAGTGAPNLQFGKARSNTAGTYTIVQDDDNLGQISFLGADGTDLANYAAVIRAQVDGSPASNNIPGRLVFQTASGGTNSERMRIDSNGDVSIGSATNGGGNRLLIVDSHTEAFVNPSDSILRITNENASANNNQASISFTCSSTGVGADSAIVSQAEDASGNSSLQFWTDTTNGMTEKLRITSAGRIGINNTNPAYLFDVQGTSVIARFKSTNNNNVFALSGNNASDLVYLGTNSSGDFLLSVGNSITTRLNVSNAGRVRLSGVPGVAGSNLTNVSIESDGNLCTTTSLRKYKTNITTMSDTSWLYDLNPVTFNWKKKTEVDGETTWEDTADNNGTQYGLIAEEVKEVKNDFCYYDNNGDLSGVHYDRLIAPLIKALQEQKAEIDALKTKVATLEGS